MSSMASTPSVACSFLQAQHGLGEDFDHHRGVGVLIVRQGAGQRLVQGQHPDLRSADDERICEDTADPVLGGQARERRPQHCRVRAEHRRVDSARPVRNAVRCTDLRQR